MSNRGQGDGAEGAGTVQSVDRAVAILEILARDGEAGVTEVARELEVHKSTASRLLAALDRRELVARDAARGKFRLGVGIVRLAGAVSQKLDVVQESRPVCRALAQEVARPSTWPSCPGTTRSTWTRWRARRRCPRTTGPGSASRCTRPRTARSCWPTCPTPNSPRA